MKTIFTETTKAAKIIVVVLIATIALGTVVEASVGQNGSDVKYTKHYIVKYSDKDTFYDYSYVTLGRKKNAGKVLHVTVTHMYDENGNTKDADWTYTRWRVDKAVNGKMVTMASNIKIKRTKYSDITMSSRVETDKTLRVSARGNSSKYNARISGYIHNFKIL